MSNIYLEAKGLGKIFKDGQRELIVLKDIDLAAHMSELVAIVGSSGSGKSTLLQLLGALDTPSTGDVKIMGKTISQLTDDQVSQLRNRHIGYVYQFHHLLPEFTALENVCMPLLMRKDSLIDNIQQQAAHLLERVGLSKRISHKPGELSGGERQRVAIARALVTKPQILLADEPTGNLDGKNAKSIFELIKELKNEMGIATLFVTHDMNLARQAETIMRLEDGRWQS